jgi:hypothetical protein
MTGIAAVNTDQANTANLTALHMSTGGLLRRLSDERRDKAKVAKRPT